VQQVCRVRLGGMDWMGGHAGLMPLLAPLREIAGTCRDWPSRAQLQARIDAAGLRVATGFPLHLAEAGSDLPYELRLHRTGVLGFRERNLHDWFNLMAWFAFPGAKAALNARHCAAWADAATGSRGAVRDALTLFDESGVVVLAEDPQLLTLIRGFEWKALFCGRRDDCRRRLRVLPFGHALCEKALAPYHGITGHALMFEVAAGTLAQDDRALLAAADQLLAARIADPQALATTRDLAPLPLLGIPDWCAANADPAYYDDTRQFRSGRRPRAVARPG
jgi:hypothetical protein